MNTHNNRGIGQATTALQQNHGRLGGHGQDAESSSPAPAHEIPNVIEQLYFRTEHLSTAIAKLENRLTSVLREAIPSDICSLERKASTDVGLRLVELEARLVLMIQSIDSIADRLEL